MFSLVLCFLLFMALFTSAGSFVGPDFRWFVAGRAIVVHLAFAGAGGLSGMAVAAPCILVSVVAGFAVLCQSHLPAAFGHLVAGNAGHAVFVGMIPVGEIFSNPCRHIVFIFVAFAAAACGGLRVMALAACLARLCGGNLFSVAVAFAAQVHVGGGLLVMNICPGFGMRHFHLVAIHADFVFIVAGITRVSGFSGFARVAVEPRGVM